MHIVMWLLSAEGIEAGADSLHIKSGFFWVVMPCSLERAFVFRRNCLPSASLAFLLGLLFDPEGEDDLLL
jgi:hypothetical protein